MRTTEVGQAGRCSKAPGVLVYELGKSDRKHELRMSSQTLKICNNTLIRDDLPPSLRSIPLLLNLRLQVFMKPLEQPFHMPPNRRPSHEHDRRIPLPRSKMPEQRPPRVRPFGGRRRPRREVERPRGIQAHLTTRVLVAEHARAVLLQQI